VVGSIVSGAKKHLEQCDLVFHGTIISTAVPMENREKKQGVKRKMLESGNVLTGAEPTCGCDE
jgi:hypothetical protein